MFSSDKERKGRIELDHAVDEVAGQEVVSHAEVVAQEFEKSNVAITTIGKKLGIKKEE